MRLVRFKDGTFGIRRWVFIYQYLDLKSSGFWWDTGSVYFSDCRGSLEKCVSALSDIKKINNRQEDKGTLI